MDNYVDFFERDELIASIERAPFVPSQLGASGLFETRGVGGTSIAIEALPDDDVSESSAIPRGAPAGEMNLEKRSVITFTASTYAKQIPVLADEVLNARAAGVNGARLMVADLRDRAVAKLRNWADFQHEYLRVTALNSPTNGFGSAPAAAVVAFGASDTVAVNESLHTNVTIALESALGGVPYSGITAYCSDTYWKALIKSKTVRETYLNYTAAAALRGAPVDQFDYLGINWVRYRAQGNAKIADGEAKVVPMGVPGLFIQAFAPDDTIDSVGAAAIGQPYYLRAYDMDDDKGWRLKMQTHPVMVCTRPTAVITLDLS